MSEERTDFEITEQERTEQSQIRRDKLAELQAAGRNPFLQETWDQTAYSQDIKDNFEDYDGKEVVVRGWVRGNRSSNQFGFISLNDGSFFSPVQVVYEADKLSNQTYYLLYAWKQLGLKQRKDECVLIGKDKPLEAELKRYLKNVICV